jgi:hypothetical protein
MAGKLGRPSLLPSATLSSAAAARCRATGTAAWHAVVACDDGDAYAGPLDTGALRQIVVK